MTSFNRLFNSNLSLCPENLNTFFFGLIKYEGSHEIELTSVAKFGPEHNHKYQVWGKCIRCGYEFHNFGIGEVEMVRLNLVDPDKGKIIFHSYGTNGNLNSDTDKESKAIDRNH